MDINYVKKNLISEVVSGSFAYGINTATSDIDLRGCYVATPEQILGVDNYEEQYHVADEDTVYCELKTFFKHCTNGTPNWIEILFVKPEQIKISTKYWQEILNHKYEFLTQSMVKKSLGYINNMHKRFSNNDYDVSVMRKQACHAIRAGRMINEMLLNHDLSVFREKDKDYLIAVKMGNIMQDEVVNEIQKSLKNIEDNLTITKLPLAPNKDKINALSLSLYLEFWKERKLI